MNKQEILNYIQQTYNPTKETCIPTVHPEYQSSDERESFEIACMIAGLKNVYFTDEIGTLQQIDQKLLDALPLFDIQTNIFTQEFFSKVEHKENEIYLAPTRASKKLAVFYTPEGERNALLLMLWFSQINLAEAKEVGSWMYAFNPYFKGTLLSYDPKDIEFFYHVAGFKEDPEVALETQQLIFEKPYTSWPEEVKLELEAYAKNMYPETQTFELYLRDKAETNAWLEHHQGLSIDEIKQQIEHINAHIEPSHAQKGCC